MFDHFEFWNFETLKLRKDEKSKTRTRKLLISVLTHLQMLWSEFHIDPKTWHCRSIGFWLIQHLLDRSTTFRIELTQVVSVWKNWIDPKIVGSIRTCLHRSKRLWMHPELFVDPSKTNLDGSYVFKRDPKKFKSVQQMLDRAKTLWFDPTSFESIQKNLDRSENIWIDQNIFWSIEN